MIVNLQTLESLERRELRERKAISQSRAIRRQKHANRRAAQQRCSVAVPAVEFKVLSWESVPAGLSTAAWLALPGSEDTL